MISFELTGFLGHRDEVPSQAVGKLLAVELAIFGLLGKFSCRQLLLPLNVSLFDGVIRNIC